MIRFVYPNVSFSGREFIGCGRFALFPRDSSPPPSYWVLDGLPNTANTSALIKAAKVLSRIPYKPERLIYENEDPHSPEEDYQGDSCSLAFLLALIQRARDVWGKVECDIDVWCTGTIRFDDRPFLEAVFPSGFDVKLTGFLDPGHPDSLFIVPAANVLQHHEALCRGRDVRIVELSQQRDQPWYALLRQKTILKVDFDELPDLVDWLFEPVNDAGGLSDNGTPGGGNPRPCEQGVSPRTGTLGWGLGAVLSVLFIAFIVYFSGFLRSTMEHGDPQAQELFSLLHRARLDEADALLQSMDGGDALRALGRAALELNRGDLQSVQTILKETREGSAAAPYATIVQGHLLLARGRQADAEEVYRLALAGGGLEPWQAAEGHFGLGRIHLQREQYDQALHDLTRAADLDPFYVQAHTARGLALERLGLHQEAFHTFARASAINPDEPISDLLSRRWREKLDEEREAGRRARIDALLTDLSMAYRRQPKTRANSDGWSSRPLTIVFLPFEAVGLPATREGEDVFIYEKIVRAFVGSTRIKLVDRAVMERLLEELKLSSSEASDPETALRLGKILSARVIAVGGVNRYAGELEVTLRAIDTESSLVSVAASDACSLAEPPRSMLEKLASDFRDRIEGAYPIRGRLASVEGVRVQVDVGGGVGVTPGMKFVLVEGEKQGLELRVTEVQPDSSTAVCSDAAVPLRTGWRVEGT